MRSQVGCTAVVKIFAVWMLSFWCLFWKVLGPPNLFRNLIFLSKVFKMFRAKVLAVFLHHGLCPKVSEGSLPFSSFKRWLSKGLPIKILKLWYYVLFRCFFLMASFVGKVQFNLVKSKVPKLEEVISLEHGGQVPKSVKMGGIEICKNRQTYDECTICTHIYIYIIYVCIRGDMCR